MNWSIELKTHKKKWILAATLWGHSRKDAEDYAESSLKWFEGTTAWRIRRLTKKAKP